MDKIKRDAKEPTMFDIEHCEDCCDCAHCVDSEHDVRCHMDCDECPGCFERRQERMEYEYECHRYE